MWQLYVLGSMFANAGENVVDKAALVGTRAIDPAIASFYRPLLFFFVTGAVGLLGWLGPLHLFFHWSLFLFAPVSMFAAMFYTYLLGKIEVTSIGAATYLTPFVFLFVDTNIWGIHFSYWQIAGIILLVLGGIAFSLDGETRRFKPEMTKWVWVVFLFNVFYAGGEMYLFKYLNHTYGVNTPSFFTTLWLLATLGLLLVVFARRKTDLLFARPTRSYIPRVAVSKVCDGAASLLWGQALIFATVTQVNAFEAMFPLVLFIVAVIGQKVLKLKLKEKFDRTHASWKFGAVLLLVAGGFLVG